MRRTYPASEGIKRTCIPYPWDASPDPDAGPTCTPGEWTLDTIDDTPNPNWPALAVDDTGIVHVVFSAGGDPTVLWYAHGQAGAWTVVETPEAGGGYPQIAIDSSATVHIVHGGWPGGLRYLQKGVSEEDFDYELVAPELAFDIGFDLDANERPVACFLDGDAGGPPICHQRDGDAWNAIDSPGGGTKAGIAIAIDTSNTLHLTADGVVYVAREAGDWGTEEIVDDNGDLYPSLAADAAGVPHVAYRNFQHDVVHASRAGADDWNRVDIENNVEAASPSLFIDANDTLHVAYVDLTNMNLKYARRVGDVWDRKTVDSTATIPATPRVLVDKRGAVHVDQNDDEVRYAYLCP